MNNLDSVALFGRSGAIFQLVLFIVTASMSPAIFEISQNCSRAEDILTLGCSNLKRSHDVV